jgi:IS605 OrfB family transposase
VQGRDYGFKTGNQVSILTLQGRLILPYHGYSKHVTLIHEGAEIGSAKLWYDQRRKRFYLLVPLTLTMPDPQPTSLTEIVGVDVGQRYLATVTAPTNQTQFYSGKEARAKADHYARLQKRLQRKGTRSATRRKMALAGRERRFKLAINHTISKQIIDTHPHALIGLEELTGIRDRTKRRKKRRKGKKLLPLTPQQRKANRHASKWAFAELQGFVAYKATLAGSACIKIDADYTSQMCPRCGHTDQKNRPDKGLLFVCQVCHFTLHADLIGARNISLRTLLVRHDWARTGQLSVAPDVADKEAKAARLQRYAELRWSPVTSPSPFGEG